MLGREFFGNKLKYFNLLNRCLNACTYCKTKHARGDLASYPIEELVDRAKQSFQGKIVPLLPKSTLRLQDLTLTGNFL